MLTRAKLGTEAPRQLTIDDLPAFLTVEQLSELLQFPVETVYRWVAVGFGPRPTPMGRGKRAPLRYSAIAVRTWVNSTDHEYAKVWDEKARARKHDIGEHGAGSA